MGEFELIATLFQPLADTTRRPELLLGLGDDCAIQRLPPGQDLVFSVDTLVEGVHFPAEYDPEHLGWRALAVATSDLAAMGAAPVCFTLALTLPDADPDWLERFVAGLRKAALSFGLALAGGDTTRGPLVLSLQVHGQAPAGQALRRHGARPGDLVCVSGPLGGAAAALDCLATPDAPGAARLLACYHWPQPRLTLGQWLRGRASSCIDISDGLRADLGHILAASGVGARLRMADIPLVPGATLRHALEGGDDYELCFTLPPGLHSQLIGYAARAESSVPVVVGEVTVGSGLTVIAPDGQEQQLDGPPGYDHFRP